MRLWVGKRVGTKLGPGRVVRISNAKDEVRGHGRPVRGLAFVEVELDKGGRRLCPAREVTDLPP